MSEDIKKFIEDQKSILSEERKRLELEEKHLEKNGNENSDEEKENCDTLQQQNNNEKQSTDLENSNLILPRVLSPNRENLLSTNQLDKSSYEGIVEKNKQAFINHISNSENPLTVRSDDIKCAMLRYGEYSPNNPQLRVTAAPYLGFGEYEQRRNLFLQRQKADYLRHLAKKNESIKEVSKHVQSENKVATDKKACKAVQTDIQNIHCQLIQYELQNSPEKELSPHPASNYLMQNNRNSLASYRIDQRLTSAQNALLKAEMDKPKSILSNRRTGSPRDRLMSSEMHHQQQHGYTPSFMDGFSYTDRADEVERERLKRESYQMELRMQIEEKRRMQSMREEQERREQELENRRLEQQLLRMQEEQMMEEQRRNRREEQMRRHSEDLYRRKQDLQSRGFRKHTDSESSVTSLRSTEVASKALSHYSPPVSRRNPYSFNVPSTSVFAETPTRYNPSRFDSYHRKDTLNRMDSLNSYDGLGASSSTAAAGRRLHTFGRYDSLSRIDSLTHRIESLGVRDSLGSGQRRHSATQQDLSAFRRSPKLQRRSSSGRFEDTLPIPVLKAHSPVAKELKNSIPFNSSRHSSDAVRKLEDKWQIPAVQKNIVNHLDSSRDSQNRSILTQLGAIRMQLQQEQLRMDETLRKRGYSQSKAVDFH